MSPTGGDGGWYGSELFKSSSEFEEYDRISSLSMSSISVIYEPTLKCTYGISLSKFSILANANYCQLEGIGFYSNVTNPLASRLVSKGFGTGGMTNLMNIESKPLVLLHVISLYGRREIRPALNFPLWNGRGGGGI